MRGVIQNVARKQQILDFRDLKYGNITPTDIDAAIEYHDKARILIEFKYCDAALPYGQRLALERFVRDFEKAGMEAIAIVAEHQTHDAMQSVPAGTCQVREICYKHNYAWRPPKYSCTVKELVDSFIDFIDKSFEA